MHTLGPSYWYSRIDVRRRQLELDRPQASRCGRYPAKVEDCERVLFRQVGSNRYFRSGRIVADGDQCEIVVERSVPDLSDRRSNFDPVVWTGRDDNLLETKVVSQSSMGETSVLQFNTRDTLPVETTVPVHITWVGRFRTQNKILMILRPRRERLLEDVTIFWSDLTTTRTVLPERRRVELLTHVPEVVSVLLVSIRDPRHSLVRKGIIVETKSGLESVDAFGIAELDLCDVPVPTP
jgi:hypothetical protein